MVGASKILTVSYGTFSCTLEGFDEPFNTMKAIAEYFRDLAAEDRYFGAEPPQPDAEMLHRIAEREMSRRVEAKIQNNSILLRPSPEEPAAVPVAAQTGVPPRIDPPLSALATPTAAESVSESVAAKLQRIRSAIAQARSPQGEGEGAAEAAPAFDGTAQNPSALRPTAPVANMPTETPIDAPADVLLETPTEIAAVAQPEGFGFALDISGPLSTEETADLVAAPAAETAAEAAAEAAVAADDAEAEARAQAAAAVEAPEAVAPETVSPEIAATAPAELPAEPARSIIRAQVIKLRRTVPQDAPADALLAAVSAQLARSNLAPPAAAPGAVRAETDADLEDFDIADFDLAETEAVEADQIKTEAVEAEPAKAGDTPLEIAPDLTPDLAVADFDSPEADDQPAETPPQVLAEEDDFDIEAFEEDLERLDREATHSPPPMRPAAMEPPRPEGNLPRLMEKADAQMSISENRRRISAIAHLKAAVAATVAERRAEGETVPKDETAPYRQDLTQAVRPRRPVMPAADGPHHAPLTTRPGVRPAPLVLVSEQRVDRPPKETLAKVQVIRPRRITTACLADDDADESFAAEETAPLSPQVSASFADFARARAPKGLAELLEAAAAHIAQVEGRPHFSPPQIMSKIAAAGAGDFSREDLLRVFGTLLRQGKIAKVKRGQYAITEASRFYHASA